MKVDEKLYDQAPSKVVADMYMKLESPRAKKTFAMKKVRKQLRHRKKVLFKKMKGPDKVRTLSSPSSSGANGLACE